MADRRRPEEGPQSSVDIQYQKRKPHLRWKKIKYTRMISNYVDLQRYLLRWKKIKYIRMISNYVDLQRYLLVGGYRTYPGGADYPVIYEEEVAVEGQLYEEAFVIFKKFNLNVLFVLLDNIRDINRAVEFAFRVEEDTVWSQVGKAQLREGLVSDAIESFIRADDATQFLEVIRAAEDADVYHDLVKYLLMVRQKAKEPKVDSELIYAYAKIDRLGDIEEFILMPNVANLPNVGDRLYDEALYEAAKIIFAFISNWAKLASTLVKLKQFQGAVDAARKANSSKTWKEVCFACVDAEEFRLAQICGLNIIVQVDDLEEVSEYYQNRGCFNELISLMESGLGLERAHMGIFTELGVLYARYRYEKLMEHIKLFSTRLNIPKLIRACDERQHWKELTYL